MKALIFDVDGTLADTEKDGHRIAFNKAFAGAGLDWDWGVDLYGELLSITGGKERIKHFIDRFSIEMDPSIDLDAFIGELHKAKTKHYKSLISQGRIPLRPGVEQLINSARGQGVRLAIATTTTLVNVTALISNTLGEEAIEWFEVIGAGDIVASKKPAPDIYTWVLQKMHLNGSQAIAFEDSENGVKSAIGADIDTVVVTTNAYTKDHDFSGATVILDSLLDCVSVDSDHSTVANDLAWLNSI